MEIENLLVTKFSKPLCFWSFGLPFNFVALLLNFFDHSVDLFLLDGVSVSIDLAAINLFYFWLIVAVVVH